MNKLKSAWAQKDQRNLLINIILAFVIKGAALLVSLFSLPLYIGYFNNNEMLGVWYTVLSLLSWIMVLDFGLGNGLRNRLAESLTLGDTVAAKQYISSTYVALSVIILPILLIGSILLQYADLNAFLNVSSSLISNEALRLSVTILFCGIGVSFVLKIVNAAIYAIQKSYINNLLTLVTSLLPLVYIALFKGESLDQNLYQLSIVHVVAINLPLLVMTIVLFRNPNRRSWAPALKSYEAQTAKQMINFGMKFFFSQIFFMFLMSTNEIIITRYFSVDAVVPYSIYNRLFTAVGSLFMLALTPLWSKVTKDLAERKYRTIQRTNRVLYRIAALAILAEILLVPFSQLMIDLWLGENSIVVDYTTAFIFAAFGGIYILNIVLTTVANGMGALRTQAVIYGISAILKLPVILLLKSYFDSWNVVVLYNCVALLIFCAFQYFWIEKKIREYIQLEQN